MSDQPATVRLSKAAREFNIGVITIREFLGKKGFAVDNDPNSKLSQEMYLLLVKEFAPEKHIKEEARKITFASSLHQTITIEDKRTAAKDREKELEDLFIKNVGLEYDKKSFEPQKKIREAATSEPVQKEGKKATAEPVKEPVLKKEPAKPGEKKATPGKTAKKPVEEAGTEAPKKKAVKTA